MRIFDFLNANQGAVMALLTAVYVIATVVTTVMIWRSNNLVRKSNDLSRLSLEQNSQFERERNRPYVIFDFALENDCLNAVLRNIGKTPALNVMVDIDKPIKRLEEGPIAFVGHPIAFMAPGRTITDGINVVYDVFKEDGDMSYVVKIRYGDTRGAAYSEQFALELNHLRNLIRFQPEDHAREAVKELGKIQKQLGDISRSAFQIVWEQNSLLERTATEELLEDKDFDARAFLCANFDDNLRREGRMYMGLSRYHATAEDEKVRADILRCERLGFLRREANYFVLTEAGHILMKQKGSSSGVGITQAANQEPPSTK